LVAGPVTVNTTETGALSMIELLAGETLTVGVPLGAVPPPVPFPPLLPLLLDEDEPQPTTAKPAPASRMQTPSMFLHFAVPPGTRKIRRASTAELPAALNHSELAEEGCRRLPVVGAVVVTATLAAPVVAVAFSETEEPVVEQVGKLVAPDGAEVNAQLSVTMPVKPLLLCTVTVDAADAPGAIADGFVAERVKVDGGTGVTVTVVELVADA